MLSKQEIIFIDGHALAFRAYHALIKTNLHTKDNVPTWAAYGFSKILFDIIKKFKPYYIVVAFDVSKKTFRNEIYPEYKANRGETPEEFLIQLPFITQIINAFEIPIFELDNYEADDLIGTLSIQANKIGLKSHIITGDQDLIQLVNENTFVYLPNRNDSTLKKFGINETIEKYQIGPQQIVDYKALIGDKSDNIPGIFGLGPKTAIKLLNQFNDLENIYKNLDKIESKRLKDLLVSGKDNAFLSKKLATIDVNAPINLDLNKSHLNLPNEENIRNLLNRLQFRSLLNELPEILSLFYSENKNKISNEKKININVKIIKNTDELKELSNLIKKLKYFSIDIETTSLDFLTNHLVGIAISLDTNNKEKICNNFQSFYIPISHINYDFNINIDDFKKEFKEIIENPNILKIGHNIKFEINVFSKYGIDLKGIKDDTYIADYLIDPNNSHALKEMAFHYLNYKMTRIEELIGKGKNALTMDYIDVEEVSRYACADSSITLELSFYLRKKLEEMNMIELYQNIEIPLIKVLSKMESEGIKIDKEHLSNLSSSLDLMLKDIESKIYQIAGKEFNINSPKQLSSILFEELKISTKGLKRGKSQAYSTDANILEKLRNEHDIVKYILDYRQISKLKSTYIDSLLEITDKNSRIHTSFNQAITSTGRLSSSNPNLQNIPIKTKLGKEIRKAFIADNNKLILSADYSQIELRLLAHYSSDPIFIDAFNNDLDIHSKTAMEIFNIKNIEDITEEQRRIAKTVNFGIIYGQSAYGLSETLNISVSEASDIIKKFNETYKYVSMYVENIIKFAQEKGYVTTLLNRRRYIPELNSSNYSVREFGKRMAINTPLQGTAADLIKLAMVKIDKYLEESNKSSKMLLQVHDELVFEVYKDELEELKVNVKNIMENIYTLNVPLKVSISIGKNWYE
ncbi:MAG: DNA polymerase I [Candidatus Sericytochromatia bacterium]|nr:MAG: DNA polymerase I [Candidatus Sericytochromatia bacterium]